MYTALSPFDEPTTHRLERPLDELVPAPAVARTRRLRSALMAGGAIGLIPCIVFLVSTLPADYVALGFDVLLLAFMVTTVVLVFLRRAGYAPSNSEHNRLQSSEDRTRHAHRTIAP